ncbi:MAG: hypothetical protein PHR44_07205 [Candidatus Omnitrophica bacterium]|nr:hypothetical protein [Candidatus Omnitrophota bacterium]
MIKNIIILARQNLNEWNFRRYGIKTLEDNGFKVEYWDITPFLHPELFKQYKASDYVDFKGTKFFYDAKTLYGQLLDLDQDSVIFDAITFQFKLLDLYRVISRAKAEYIVALLNAMPDVRDIDRLNGHRRASVIMRKLKSLSRHTPSGLYKRLILPLLPLGLFGVKPARFFMAGGEGSVNKHRLPLGKNTELVWGHNLDYDVYLEESKKTSRERDIAVFLDICPALDWNYFYEGVKSNYDIDRYYGLLDDFFGAVERDLKLEVVIAAHPRSRYDELPDYYKGRKCIKGKTAELIREAKLVLTQSSTAVSLANLFLKPVVFLAYDGMQDSKFIEVLAQLHGKRAVYIDKESKIDWENELKVSQPHYRHYRQQFLKCDWSENLPLWQILANRLKQV